MKTEGLGGSCHSLSSLQIKCLHLELPLVPLYRLKLMCHCCSAACSAAEIAVLPKPREEKEEHSQLCLWKWLRVGRTLNRGYGGDRNGSGEEGMREGVGAALSPRFRGLAPPRPLGQMWRGWGGGDSGSCAVPSDCILSCPAWCEPCLPASPAALGTRARRKQRVFPPISTGLLGVPERPGPVLSVGHADMSNQVPIGLPGPGRGL